MLRHLTQATSEYRGGSKALLEFNHAQQHSNNAITLYLRGLTHLEQAIIHCDLAVGLSHAIACCLVRDTPKDHFKFGENTPEERLRFLSNAIKHFNRTVVEGKLTDCTLPVWMVTEGLKSIFEPKKGETPIVKVLQFRELADILGELASNAKFFAEDVYRIASER